MYCMCFATETDLYITKELPDHPLWSDNGQWSMGRRYTSIDSTGSYQTGYLGPNTFQTIQSSKQWWQVIHLRYSSWTQHSLPIPIAWRTEYLSWSHADWDAILSSQASRPPSVNNRKIPSRPDLQWLQSQLLRRRSLGATGLEFFEPLHLQCWFCSFFQNYGQTYVPEESCQLRLIQIPHAQGLWLYNIFTWGVMQIANPTG